jgi:ATP-dependent protease HslVU (ClpYQ) peptidase subunit
VTAKTRYRFVAYELHADAETVVMDSTGDGFIAATGTIIHAGHMTVEIGSGGPTLIQEHLADLIAEETT